MTTNHPTAGTVSGLLNLLQTKGNRQHVSIICQTLSQIFRESLIIMLQILNVITSLCYYMDADCIDDRKQINNNLQHLQILGTL
jgi:hypothetical protein